MKKEVFDLIKKELQYIGISFVFVFAMLKIAFYDENFLVALRVCASLFWLFALPGYGIMLYWHDKLNFFERFVVGAMLAGGIIGTLSYYIGLLGLNIKHHAFLLSLFLILIGLLAAIKKKADGKTI